MITTIVKRLVFTCMMIFCFVNAPAQIQKGKYSIGYSIGYTTSTKNEVMNVDFRYSLTDAFRISPSLAHLMNDEGYKGWFLETNLHYVFAINDAFAVYPLAGICYNYWDYYDKVTKKYRKGEGIFGPNIGLGTDIYVINELVVGVDLRYNMAKKHDQLLASFRIAYHFAY